MMQNLFNPAIQCTDPDNLQFCLKVSDTVFWYCEPNIYHESIYIAGTKENLLYEKYKGNPTELLEAAKIDPYIKSFCTNRIFWLHGEVDVNDLSLGERLKALSDYSYTWDSFTDDVERNQIICENYFEQNPMDFRDDI